MKSIPKIHLAELPRSNDENQARAIYKSKNINKSLKFDIFLKT